MSTTFFPTVVPDQSVIDGAYRYEAIRPVPLTPNIGAEIENIDLTKPLSALEIREVQNALAEFQVIFFRDQPISLADHERIARHFGDLHIHVGPSTESKPLPENPAIRQLHFDETSPRVAGEFWHSDQTCAEAPPMGSMLHLIQTPPKGGGPTLFASMYAAYEGLSPQLKAFFAGMTATHDGRGVFGPAAPVSSHPIIVRHPVTNRKLIFVNPAFTTHIDGLPRAESDALLQFLYNHNALPHFQVRFQWQPHSIALWDNRCTQHQAIWDYYPHVRSGYRIQIKSTGKPLMG